MQRTKQLIFACFLLPIMLFFNNTLSSQSIFTHNKDSVIRIILLFNSNWNHQVILENCLYEFPHGGDVGVIYAKIHNVNEDTIKITVRSRPNVFYKWRYCNMYVEKKKIQDCLILHGGSIYKPSCFEIRYSYKNLINTRYRGLFNDDYLSNEKYFFSRKIRKLKTY